MLPGVQVFDIKKLPDERGFFAEGIRADWSDLLDSDTIVQANISLSYPGMIRAWHRHRRGQVDYFIVLQGAMRICAFDDEPSSPTRGQLDELVASSERLQVVRVPGKYWHGTKTISPKPSLTLYMVNRLYDYSNPDEDRRAWNDSTITDPRTGSPYDWDHPVHK